MPDLVRVEIDDAVATVTLSRPKLRNALSGTEMVDAVVFAIEGLSKNANVRAAILTGEGSAFSSGGDLNQLKANAELARTEPQRIVDWYRDGIQRIPLAIAALEVPLIAAVNGPAIGAGCDLACMCDIRIAARSARFAESFVKLGIVPGDGGAWFLPRIVGKSKACEMAFTGESVSAEEALACGLVSRVVEDGELIAAARDLAGRIAANPGSAVRMTKRLMKEAETGTLASVLQLSAAFQALAHSTPEHRAAIERLTTKT